MGNTLDWAALPVLIEFYGIDDAAMTIRLLLAIKAVLDNEQQHITR